MLCFDGQRLISDFFVSFPEIHSFASKPSQTTFGQESGRTYWTRAPTGRRCRERRAAFSAAQDWSKGRGQAYLTQVI